MTARPPQTLPTLYAGLEERVRALERLMGRVSGVAGAANIDDLLTSRGDLAVGAVPAPGQPAVPTTLPVGPDGTSPVADSTVGAGIRWAVVVDLNGAGLDSTAVAGSEAHAFPNASGRASVAIGSTDPTPGGGPEALGTGSVAVGASSHALLDGGTAVGMDASAAGANDTAVGQGASASGGSGVAVGQEASSATSAVAVGASAAAPGIDSVAIGPNSFAGTDDTTGGGVAVGSSALASDGSVAVGKSADASVPGASALGAGANAGHSAATALGKLAATTKADQVMLGAPGVQVIQGAPPIGPGSGILAASQITFWIDESGSNLKVSVLYSDGTTSKSGSVALT